MTRDDARYEALTYVHLKLTQGATAEVLRERVHEGYMSPIEPGYVIERGRITVPGASYKGEQHRFAITELVAEIEAKARDEFWRHWREYRRDPEAADGYLGLAIQGLRVIGVRHGLFPVPRGPAGFDHLKTDPVQGDLFGAMA